MVRKMKLLGWVAYGLLTIGGLVHGSQALGYYAVDELLPMFLAKVVYGLVGLAGVYALYGWYEIARR